MIVPKGKLIIFKKSQDELLPGINLVLEEDITLNLSSQFEPLLGSFGGKWTAAFGAIAAQVFGKGGSGQFKQMGFQSWTRTDPIGFSFTVGLYQTTNAEKDVMVPARALMKLPLPYDAGISDRGIGLIAPGPTILDQFTKFKDYIGSDIPYKALSLRVGPIWLPQIIVKKVEPTFSNEIDDTGGFMWCKLRIDINSLSTATENDIDKFHYSSGTNGNNSNPTSSNPNLAGGRS